MVMVVEEGVVVGSAMFEANLRFVDIFGSLVWRDHMIQPCMVKISKNGEGEGHVDGRQAPDDIIL